MSDLPIRSGSQPQPASQPTAPRPAAWVAAPRVPGDSLQLRTPAAPAGSGSAADALDKSSWWASMQTFAQGTVRVLSISARTVARGKAFVALANVLDGDKLTIARGAERLTTKITATAARVLPGQAARINRFATPLIRGAGSTLRAVGKAAPVLNVIAATWDTTKAIAEKDPAKQPGAWANAGLSISGTALAVGAVVIGASPIGWAAGIAAASVAGFQLADTLIAGGAWSSTIGKAVGGWFR